MVSEIFDNNAICFCIGPICQIDKMFPLFLSMRKDFFIDKITNSIDDARSGRSFETEILPVTAKDLEKILKKNGWQFNWRKEFELKERKLYKLVLKEHSAIEGLISYQIEENYIEMHLIETAPHNFGASKKYVGVPANLVAYACKTSFDLDFDGYVAFTSKTQLIKHYIDTLGAELIFRNRMIISGKAAKKLVNSYYKDYFSGK